ncbi:hypothetical protein [Haloterrigena alkaliphila]|uniref:Uncharacterized protein n=1 Tax=Haloterrigena alkaliphila TaxID=2816475 RepID=A0A8A2VMY0_9EURY|nr:hypothetical protein [Haloterrigena alkaliphila]QSW99488.1 hypothetical protein J0X25_00590 [Haloterrigena alkaliphila]
MTLERRELLRLAGATTVASTVGIAGCLGGSDPTDDDAGDENSTSAPYRNWLVTDEEDGLFVAYADWDRLEALEAADTEVGANRTESPDDANPMANEEDVMLAAPLMGTFFVAFGVMGTLGTGLEGLLGGAGSGAMGGAGTETGTDGEDGEAADEDGERFETSVDDLFWVNDAYVITGSIDTGEIHETLTRQPESEYGLKTVYERSEGIGEFDVYEPVDGDSEYATTETAIGVSEDAVVFSMGSEGESVEQLRGPLEAYSGETKRTVDQHEDLNWLVETAGSGHVVFGAYGDLEQQDEPASEEGEAELEIGENETYDELAGANGFVGSLTIDGSTESSGTFAAVFDDIDTETKADLEASLGSSTDDATLEFDDDRVVATATWDENALEESDVAGDDSSAA